MIEVLRSGLQTTVQDLGRRGLRCAGVPAAGAMDPWAARAVNRLVGNADEAALFEILLTGPSLRFERPAAIAWVGGGFEVRAATGSLEAGLAHRLPAGAVLEIGRASAGPRAWLAVGGGLDLAPVLGSRATDLAAAFGGHAGRALAAGDRLSVGRRPPFVARRLTRSLTAGLARSTLRFLAGPDSGGDPSRDGSPDRGALDGDFRVTSRSDRRGLRLEGPSMPRAAIAGATELRSQGVLPGCVERTPSGELIVLSVDGPVTGGYPWIAQVIEADVGRLAHLAPGAAVRFQEVDTTTAERALAERERELAEGVLE
jgi:biotin-dependent carboxylase-like uncharacterized protein